jgi:SOS response regulatory protein OraA/RecX
MRAYDDYKRDLSEE